MKRILGVTAGMTLLWLTITTVFFIASPPKVQAAPGVPRVLAEKFGSAGPAYNCSAGTCDVTLVRLEYDVSGFTCYVSHAATAARNVTVTLFGDDGTTVLFTSAALSCASGTPCSVTVGPQATTAVANNAVVPVVPTRSAKVTVAAGGTTGNATVFCLGR